MNTRRIAPFAAVFVALSLAVSGCAADTAGTNDSTASSTPTAASPTPTESATASTGGSGSAGSGGSSSGTGCAPNGVPIPDGANTSPIADVDGDGQPDTQFYVEVPSFAYGISTASGATFLLDDDLAGPGGHYGWSAPLENGPVVTVLDDGRAATLHAFVACAFVTTLGPDGTGFRSYLNGFSDTNTGVQCSDDNGGRGLDNVLATRLDTGRYTITNTPLTLSADGASVSLGSSYEVATDIAADDPRVAVAMGSSCGDVPKVGTSGM